MIEYINKQQYFKLTKKGNKYKNKIVKNTLGQIVNHSRGENQFAKDLYLELKAGKYFDVTEQVALPLVVKGKLIATIKVDFLVAHNNGELELVEYKGHATNDWRIKWKLLQALCPQYKYRLVRHI